MPAQAPAPVPLAEESVYKLIPKAQPKKESQGLFASKSNNHASSKAHIKASNLPPTYSTFGLHGTSKVCGNVAGHAAGEDPEVHPAVKPVGGMGRPVAHEVDPHNFLKRSTAATVKVAGNAGAGGCQSSKPLIASSNNKKMTTRTESEGADADQNHYNRIHEKVRPEVPVRTEKPLMGLNSKKNFVAENAKEIAGAHPKRQPEAQRAVDLPDFGKVPNYLKTIKSGIEQEKATVKSHRQAAATAVDYDELSPSEVAELRSGLQRRLDELSKAIKSLPFKLETRSQIRRKEVLEQDYNAVEAAIAKLSRKRILVMH